MPETTQPSAEGKYFIVVLLTNNTLAPHLRAACRCYLHTWLFEKIFIQESTTKKVSIKKKIETIHLIFFTWNIAGMKLHVY